MSTKLMVLVSICVLLAFSVYPDAYALEERASFDFVGASYEGDALPNSAVPVWDLATQTAVISSSGGLLSINTLVSGAGAWYLPGEYGAEQVPLANRHYTQGDPTNPWNPDVVNTGYTWEARFRVNSSVAGQWGFAFYNGEGYGGVFTNLQIFADTIKDSSGDVYYTGDLSNGFHTLRILRYPGITTDPFAPFTTEDIAIDIYVDEVYITTLTHYNFSGTLVNSGPYQDSMYMGSLSGAAKYDVDVDYIRMDFTGLYIPFAGEPACGDMGYLKADLNQDCVVDLSDVAAFALTWLDCTDPTTEGCMNCNNPSNAEYCQ